MLVPHPDIQRQRGPNPPVVLKIKGPPVGPQVLRRITHGGDCLEGIAQHEIPQSSTGKTPIKSKRRHAAEVGDLEEFFANDVRAGFEVVVSEDFAHIVNELVVLIECPDGFGVGADILKTRERRPGHAEVEGVRRRVRESEDVDGVVLP